MSKLEEAIEMLENALPGIVADLLDVHKNALLPSPPGLSLNWGGTTVQPPVQLPTPDYRSRLEAARELLSMYSRLKAVRRIG